VCRCMMFRSLDDLWVVLSLKAAGEASVPVHDVQVSG